MMSRPAGSGPQTLRAAPASAFRDPSTASRTTSLGSARLQNGKLAVAPGTGWSAPSAPSRTISSSFAQTIGGAPQPQTPLDLSEFPSLSGAPQQQQQVAAAAASSQAIWGSTGTVRGPPSTTTRSTNTPTSTTQAIRPPSQVSTQARQPETQEESSPSPFPSLGSGLDDYPFGQSPASQMARQHQQQQSVTEEFPPLGGLGVGTIGHQQRSRLGQDPMTNTIDAIGTNQNQARAGQDVLPPGIMIEPKSSPTNPGSRATPASRPAQAVGTEHNGTNGLDSSPHDQSPRPQNMSSSSQIPYRSAPSNGDSSRFAHQGQHQSSLSGGFPGPAQHAPERPPGFQMSEKDLYGLKGLQARLDGAFGMDQAAIASGMDLNTLGLDLNRSDPLCTDWAGPFADPGGRPMIPDFTLPPTYTVPNTTPLPEKIESFSDETLFMIFYQNPRDELQERAAAQLYNRDWRWHKVRQQWLTKAKEYGEPILSQNRQEERGWYYFWNVNEWKRDKREFILNYDHLYHSGLSNSM